MLCAVGDVVEDVVVHLNGPVNLGTDTVSTVTRRRGGSAANVSYFAAAVAGRSRFVGRIGDDDTGERLVAALHRAGVETFLEREGSTGTIVVVVDEHGERTMLSDRGAAPQLAHVPDAALDGTSVLHLPLYSLTHGAIAVACVDAARRAHDRNVAVSLDLSSVTSIVDIGADAVAEIVATIRPRWVLCNAEECDAAGGLDTLMRIAPWATIVTKHGAEPTEVARRGGSGWITSHHPVPPVDDVVDTTGAGDAFAAGFLVATASGATIDAGISAAHALAARTLRSAGATLAV